MKVTREQAEQNRRRIVEVAAQLFREKGFDGVSVADLMGAAGLTHGGFYGQFASKEDLMVEACAEAYDETSRRWREVLDRAPEKPVAAMASVYLSPGHRDHPGEGCVLPALGVEAARQGPSVRSAITDAARGLVALLTEAIPGRTAKARRQQALASSAAMVGAVVLARTVTDAALSDEILEAVRSQLAKLDQARAA
ncbi:MAG TPA: TetR/AcrR family transcriptional regulator [Nevskia sp.]|jgi:TetR/AcrR family transcriptional repressor of nem operon|nr:TetR/AcrR family transcriptional regulator [Nevskia sp.]